MFHLSYYLIAFCLLNKTLFRSILHTFIKIIFIKIPLHFLKLCICPYCLEDKVKLKSLIHLFSVLLQRTMISAIASAMIGIHVSVFPIHPWAL